MTCWGLIIKLVMTLWFDLLLFQGHWPFPRDKIMMGYAYILTHPGTVSFQVWTSRDTHVVFIGGLGAQVPGLFLHRCVNNAHERNWWITLSLKKFIGGCCHFLRVTWLIFRLTRSSVFSFLTLFFAGTACDFLWSFLRLWSTGPNCRADCSENSYWCPLPKHSQDLQSQFWRLCCPGWGRPSHENRAPGLEPIQTKQPHR